VAPQHLNELLERFYMRLKARFQAHPLSPLLLDEGVGLAEGSV
jgi:hypothetical protein